MRWLASVATTIAVIGLPLTAGAQAHRDHTAAPAPEPQAQQEQETPAAMGDAMGGMMPCPMMGQRGMMGHGGMMGQGMGQGPMRGMAPGMGGRHGMGPGMGTAGHMGMMGMMPGPEADAKTRGRWMQMHGEMMKAMGEILMRHGRELEGAK